jgi:hypothetical protein
MSIQERGDVCVDAWKRSVTPGTWPYWLLKARGSKIMGRAYLILVRVLAAQRKEDIYQLGSIIPIPLPPAS